MSTLRFCSLIVMVAWFIQAPSMAGMPALLPTNWTAEHNVDSSRSWNPGSPVGSMDARWQALSFFTAGVLISAWVVKRLWNLLRVEFDWLPQLDYRRALSLVVLWGLLFIVVLTMISGARELMTPGAWRKQGWTYKLTDVVPSVDDSRAVRRRALEELRLALLKYAAAHEGRFPDAPRAGEAADVDSGINPELWKIPGETGLSFLSVPGSRGSVEGRLVVYEPSIDGEERLVLLSNGMIGTMRSAEIKTATEPGGPP